MDETVSVACLGGCGPIPAGQTFCALCGLPRPVYCASCGLLVASTHTFCVNCGTPLTAARSTPPVATTPASVSVSPLDLSLLPEEEQRMDRRLVSVLFCDLVGFTPLSERLDPEEVREVQDIYFGLMSTQIERFSGTVEKYAGDAVLAIFGAPVVHEDDAERAIRCALAMHHALIPLAEETLATRGVNLMLRIGINTGEVVSGLREGGGRVDYAVTGDAVNTAARYQTAAEPGGVMVGEMTMQLASRSIRFGEVQMLTLKGKKQPVPGYPVLGLREHLAERWELASHATPLVGRDAELQELQAAWEEASRRAGRAIEIVAEPGVGKSRLLAEARKQFGGVGGLRTVHGRCLSYSSQLSLWLVADVLRDIFQLPERAAAAEIVPAVATGIETLLVSAAPADRTIAADVFGEALGLPAGNSILAAASAQVRRQGLVQSLLRLLSGIADESPILLVLEDIHWADAASREVLADALADLPTLRLLAVTTRRPEGQPLFGDALWSRPLSLQPLDADDAMTLAAAIVGGVRLSSVLEQDIADRSGGNPFFVEELLQELRQADALEERDGEIHLRPGMRELLPSSLQELLLSRLDRLDRVSRTVAQVGSVIGRTFAVKLLAGILETDEEKLDAPLDRLEEAEIALPQNGHERAYAFKHATVQETAYHTLLKKRRQALHSATARAVIELYPADEYVELIAYHYAQTDDHANAVEWLERSADRAAAVFANDVAIEHYHETRRRQDLIDAPLSNRARVDEKLGRILRIAANYDESLAILERAARAYLTSADAEGERRAVAEIGRVHRARSTPAEGIVRVTALLDAEAGVDATSGIAALHVALARLYFNLGRYHEQLEAAGRGSKLATRTGDRSVLAEAEMSRSIALFLLGHTEEALAVMRAAVPIAEEVGDFDVLNNLLGNIALIYRDMGEFERSREYRERSAEVTERTGDMANHSFALASLGEIMFLLGDWTEAERYLDRAMTIIRSLSVSWFSSFPPLLLGQLYAAKGDFVAATVCLEEALAIAEKGNHRHCLRRAIDSLAEIDLLQGNPEAGLARFDGVVDLSTLDEHDSSLTATLPVAAWARLECGDVAGAATLATLGIKRAVDEHAIVELLTAQRVAGMVSAAQGEREEAIQAFDQTVALSRQIRYLYALARALYEQALILGRVGEHAQASSSLHEAIMLFRQLGARRYEELAGEALIHLTSTATA